MISGEAVIGGEAATRTRKTDLTSMIIIVSRIVAGVVHSIIFRVVALQNVEI